MKLTIATLRIIAAILLVYASIPNAAADCFTNAPTLSVPSSYASIEAAYDAAGPGCNIISIGSGVYRETPLRLNKSLRLVNRGGPVTIMRSLSKLGIPTGYFNGQPSRWGRETFGVDISLQYTRYGPDDAETNVLAAAHNGLQVMAEVMKSPGYDSNAVQTLITRLQHYPAVCAWYLADEPDHFQISSSNAIAAYSQVKQLDPMRSIAMGFADGDLDVSPAYAAAMDIFMMDNYPVNSSGSYGEYQSPELANYYEGVLLGSKQTADDFNLPFWPILQGFDPAGSSTSPTANEERYIIYAAIQAGAKALFFWQPADGADGEGHATTWAESILTPLIAEFKNLRFTLGKGEFGAVSAAPGSVVAKLYRNDSNPPNQTYLLLLIHHGSGTLNTTVTFQNPNINSTANVNNSLDYPLPPVNLSAFQVQLGPYDVRVYRFGLN